MLTIEEIAEWIKTRNDDWREPLKTKGLGIQGTGAKVSVRWDSEQTSHPL